MPDCGPRLAGKEAEAALAQRSQDRPPVSLDVIALVTSSCGYYTGQIAQRAAQ